MCKSTFIAFIDVICRLYFPNIKLPQWSNRDKTYNKIFSLHWKSLKLTEPKTNLVDKQVIVMLVMETLTYFFASTLLADIREAKCILRNILGLKYFLSD
jgi:hypothetical protein